MTYLEAVDKTEQECFFHGLSPSRLQEGGGAAPGGTGSSAVAQGLRRLVARLKRAADLVGRMGCKPRKPGNQAVTYCKPLLPAWTDQGLTQPSREKLPIPHAQIELFAILLHELGYGYSNQEPTRVNQRLLNVPTNRTLYRAVYCTGTVRQAPFSAVTVGPQTDALILHPLGFLASDLCLQLSASSLPPSQSPPPVVCIVQQLPFSLAVAIS